MITPDFYNIAMDCIDKHAGVLQNKHKTALVYLKENPDTERLREPPLRLSYSSLQGLTNAMANAFSGLGLPRGTRVVLRLENSVEFPVSCIGAIKAGLIPVPISAQLTWPELEFILQDSEAKALVTSQELLHPELLKDPPATLKHLIVNADREISSTFSSSPLTLHRWQDLIKKVPAQFHTEPTLADAPAFWLYTSGTEDRPKAVIHAHRSIRAHDARAKHWQDVQMGDVLFNTSALNWSYALTCGLLDVWRHGLTAVVYQGTLGAELILQIIRRHGVTTLMTVPGIYRRLLPALAEQPDGLAGLRVCLSAGEKLPEEIRNRFRERSGLEIREGLGMTEHSVYLVQDGEIPVEGSCGKALPGQDITVLRDDLTPCAPGEAGILASHRSCEGLMLGYHGRPQEEAEAFREDWFLSGDLASRDAEGNYFFLGRRDEVLNSGGYRISPMEVEAAVNGHPLVEESAAVGVSDPSGKSSITAFVVLKGGSGATQETAKQILACATERLAKYKIPKNIVFLRELPKTSNGKLRRGDLRKV